MLTFNSENPSECGIGRTDKDNIMTNFMRKFPTSEILQTEQSIFVISVFLKS